MRRALKWFARIVVAVPIAVILIVGLLLSAMWWEHSTAVALPVPTGPFAIGRTMFTWMRTGVTNDAVAPGMEHYIVVWLWYPATPSAGAVTADYLPPTWRAAVVAGQGVFMRHFFKRELSVVRTHSVAEAAFAPGRRGYPVVILRAGGGAPTTDFTTLAEDLASHGYVVAGFDAAYRSGLVVLPDGRVIAGAPAYNVESASGNIDDPRIGKLLAMWTSDTAFVVSQLERLNASGRFAGGLDLQRVGMFGHSFGGATALQFCHEDARCKAAADLDGIPFGSVVAEGLNKPCMFLLSDHSRELSDPASGRILAEIQSIYDRLPDGRLYAVIRAANHFSFSDQILLNSQTAIGLLRVAGLPGLDGRRGLAIAADYVHTFFDVYLKGAPVASLAGLSKRYAEVHEGAR